LGVLAEKLEAGILRATPSSLPEGEEIA
jgi:hypothetical protein